jgi:hypothetical protein
VGTLHVSFVEQPERPVFPADELDTLARSAAAMMMNPFGMCLRIGQALIARMPIVGRDGIIMTARNDFLSMKNSIDNLAREIRRNNDRPR